MQSMGAIQTEAFLKLLRSAKPVLKSVLGPTTQILFFACPNKSIQKKRHPAAACFLRSEDFERGFSKGFPAPRKTRGVHAAPLRALPFKAFGARRGRGDLKHHAFGLFPLRGLLAFRLSLNRTSKALQAPDFGVPAVKSGFFLSVVFNSVFENRFIPLARSS